MSSYWIFRVSHKGLDPTFITFCWKRPVQSNFMQLLTHIADVNIVLLHVVLLQVVARDIVTHFLLLHIEHLVIFHTTSAHTLQLWQGIPSVGLPSQLGDKLSGRTLSLFLGGITDLHWILWLSLQLLLLCLEPRIESIWSLSGNFTWSML